MMTNREMRVVLDSNIILSSVSRYSPYKIILDKLFDGEYDLYVTNDILLEYEEKLISNFDKEVSEITLSSILLLSNVKKVEVYFNFYLIKDDVDDNKFVDCAIKSNTHYLVTNDKHFNILKTIDFPKINIINIEEFKKLLYTRKR